MDTMDGGGEDAKMEEVVEVDEKVNGKRLRRTKSFEEKQNERKKNRPAAIVQRDHIAHLWDANTNILKANVGDTWYVMSKKWLDSWREYVRWNKRKDAPPVDMKLDEICVKETLEEESVEPQRRRRRLSRLDSFGQEPGPIDSRHLEDSDSPGSLSKRVIESNDYLLINRTLWDQFVGWYGCYGVSFPRFIRKQGKGARAQNICELRPPQLRVFVVREKKTRSDGSVSTKSEEEVNGTISPLTESPFVVGRLRVKISTSLYSTDKDLHALLKNKIRTMTVTKQVVDFALTEEQQTRMWYDFKKSAPDDSRKTKPTNGVSPFSVTRGGLYHPNAVDTVDSGVALRDSWQLFPSKDGGSDASLLGDLGIMESSRPMIMLEIRSSGPLEKWPLGECAIEGEEEADKGDRDSKKENDVETVASSSKVRDEQDKESSSQFVTPTLGPAGSTGDTPLWRAGLRKGSKVDFRTDDAKWREANVVEALTENDQLVVHCLGWLRNSKHHRIVTSRDSVDLAPPHVHVRRWREQLRKKTKFEIHVSAQLRDCDAPYYRSVGTDKDSTFYIQYIKKTYVSDVERSGEWWIGQAMRRAFGHFYIVTNCVDPLKATEGWKFWAGGEGWRMERTFRIESVSEEEYRRHLAARTKPSSPKSPEEVIGENRKTDEMCVDDEVVEVSKGGDVDDRVLHDDDDDVFDDEYPRFVKLVGHHANRKKEPVSHIYERFKPDLSGDTFWNDAWVQKVNFGDGKIRLKTQDLNQVSNEFDPSLHFGHTIEDVPLDSDLICCSGTHLRSSGGSSKSPYKKDMTGESKHGRGMVGLQNIGNTCYMNSMLQCILHCNPLVEYALKPERLKREINLKNVLGTGGEVAEAFRELASALWSGRASTIRPKHFKKIFGEYNPKFAGYNQQDAMEMFGALMDNLHEDLNRVKSKPSTEPVDDEGRPDSIVAREAWNRFELRNRSVIVDQFFGQDKSQLWCPSCMKEGKSRRKFDPRLAIHVNLPTVSTRVVNIDLLRRCGSDSRRLTRYGIEIPKDNVTGRDLANALAEISGISTSSVSICEVYEQRIYKTFYVPGDDVGNVKERKIGTIDRIVAYEIGACTRPSSSTSSSSSSSSLPLGTNTHVASGEIAENEEKMSESPQKATASAGTPTTCFDQRMTSVYVKVVEESYTSSHWSNKPRKLQVPLYIVYPGEWTNAQLYDLVKRELLSLARPGTTNLPEGTRLFYLGSDGYRKCAHPEFLPNDASANDVEFVGIECVFPENASPIDFKECCLPHEHLSCAKEGHDGKPTLTLEQCLKSTFQKEQLGRTDTWYCPDCKQHVRAFKKMNIWSLADTMVLSLKRFTQSIGIYGSVVREKNATPVEIPTSIDMSPYVLGMPKREGEDALAYDLFAVSHHIGSIDYGHYVASVKYENNWFTCDDEFIDKKGKASPKIDPITAYALFFRRRKPAMLRGVDATESGGGIRRSPIPEEMTGVPTATGCTTRTAASTTNPTATKMGDRRT